MSAELPEARGAAFAAVDLGASSGRVIVGRITGARGEQRLDLEHAARFGNDPVRLRDGLRWNLLELQRQALLGLAAAERRAPGEIASIGIDSWAVDYGLLRAGRLLGAPFHYRDGRSAAAVEAVHARVDAEELFRRNGLQHLPFTTVFQLAADGDLLEVADRLLLVPDLLAFQLTGAEVAERTNASTTGLLDPRTREWDLGLAGSLGVPARLLPPLVDAGAPLGALDGDAASVVGRAIDVVAVGSHDTASAVVATPMLEPGAAYVSCGTWGLAGLELDAPVLTDDARRANFTNEGGVDGRTRFLRNVMGLWLLSESLRHWEPAATDAQRSSRLQQLLEEAARVDRPLPEIDVDDPRFLPPGDIPGRVAAWCREHGERAPEGPAELVRCLVDSLAAAFARTLAEAARLAGRDLRVVHIVGGGSQNALLCQATADRAGVPVLAGPTEATAMGNLLVQARASGAAPDDLEALRAIVARSTSPVRYAPRGSGRGRMGA